MNSKFNKETSEGLYTFSQEEVFEALAMWCRPKGIILNKESVKSFDCAHDINGFIVEIFFNHRSKKED